LIIDTILKRAVLGLLLGFSVLPGVAREKTRIVTTILPLQDFAAAVAGERGRAELLLPPGAGVHTWQFRPGDLIRIQACDLFLFIGADLEPWVPDILQAMTGKSIEILEASRGLPLLGTGIEEDEPPGHGNKDPHIWLDFGLDLQIVNKIEAALKELDPGGQALFAANARILSQRIRDLDARFRSGLRECPTKDLVIAGHGAFAYLARRYGLRQKAVYGLSPDSQPRPRGFMDLIDFCRRKNIRTVFFENSVPPDAARVLAEETGARILTLNTGHNLTTDQLKKGLGFFDLMEENLRNLKEGLSCR
jgi:zinc transport system substrate-binding protein